MISAEEISRAGFKYLGRSYKEMDCQSFVEICMRDCGLSMNLKGSNAWYREMDWTGSPEECKARFGSIPKGALLFIHAFDCGEEKRGYHDGKGNASHIGIKTGTGKGAIHSSETRGGVAESTFRDKTIPGGWNKVGLSVLFDYGEKINRILNDEDEEGGGEEPMKQKATVWAYNGQSVKMRQKPSESCKLYEEIPNGSTVDVLSRGETWSKISAAGREGWWMKTVFLVFGEVVPDDPEDHGVQQDSEDNIEITISFRAEDSETILSFLEDLREKIVTKTGRG